MFPPGVGGSEMYAYELAKALGKRGHDVDVYTQAISDKDRSVVLDNNVTVERVCRARNYLVTFETLYYSLKTRRSVAFEQYDLIHGTLMPASTIALSTMSSTDIPVVLTSHSFAPELASAFAPERPADYLLRYFFHPLNALFDRFASQSGEQIIASSTEMQDQIIDTYGLDKEQVSLIPHGIDTETFHPRGTSHPEASEHKFTALFVGRLVNIKRPELAIKAIAETNREAIELLIAGDGRQRDQLSSIAEKYGIRDKITFLGFVDYDRLPVLYSTADVTLFTSRYEGFGLVFLESMACGTPVVGVNEGGFPDIVRDGQAGYIVEDDPTEIGRRLGELVTSPDSLEQMSDAAHSRASTMDWNSVAKQVEDIYMSVIE